MNEFAILLSDLADFLGIETSALRDELKAAKISPLIFSQRAHLLPESVRQFLIGRGFDFSARIDRKIYSAQMLKGGVGKTTSLVNFAIRANMYGARVLLVDLDQQANLSFAFGADHADLPVWVDLVEEKASFDQIRKSLSPTMDIIPSNLNNSVLDRVLLNGRRNIGTSVSQYLAPVSEQYDLILIDTAPSLSAINTAAACASDRILLPVTPDRFSFVGLTKTLDELESIRIEFDAHFDTRILFTRYDGRESSSQAFLKECFGHYSDRMMKSFVRASSDIKNAVGSSRTVFSQKSHAKTDYDLVTRELLNLSTE